MMKKYFFALAFSFFVVAALHTQSHALTASVYSAALKIPIGIPTAGYGQGVPDDDPGSPFASKFPATRGLHTPLRAKVIILETKDGKMLTLLGLDSVGVDINFYRTMKEKIAKELGAQKSKNHFLVMAGTHTHAGPGRLGRNPFFWVATDVYNEWFFQYLTDQMFQIWKEARKHSFKAKLGFGMVNAGMVINDRRCENPPAKDDMLRFIRLDDDKGNVRAVIMNFNIHGTILGGDNHYFSVDAPGLIELKMEEQFDHPVLSVMVQSTGGDISPHDPKDYPLKWDKMESIGQEVADVLMPELQKTKTADMTVIKTVEFNIPLSRAALGYKDKEFPYPYGAYVCGMGAALCDEDYTTPQKAMLTCPVYGKQYHVPETVVSGIVLSDWLILTLPGEPTTPLGNDLRDKIKKELGTDKVMLWGYAQDHLGYLLLSWDWWQGGYEASMNGWGWKLGEYVEDKSLAVAKFLLKGEPLPVVLPIEPRVFKERTLVAPEKETAEKFGTMEAETKSADDGVHFKWLGGDAGVDFPEVVVEKNENGKWKPVLQKNGLPLTQNHYSTFLNFKAAPTHKENKDAKSRTFHWEVVWRAARPVPSTLVLKDGEYRFTVRGSAFDGKSVQPYAVTSSSVSLKTK